ncbi:MAG: aminotransferase class V-fold PLP-dependent enzyme [Thermoactinomyces sp.]
MIYLDNAASTWPKPPKVSDAVKKAIDEFGANPGRGGHQLAVKASQTIEETRRKLAQLFGVRDPNHLLFCYNTTHALNMAIKGILRPGDHVIITGWEHNAVARPVYWLEKEAKVHVTVVDGQDERVDWPSLVKEQIRAETRMMITIHGSNVTGEVLPIVEIGEIAKKHGIIYLVDAAQTAGLLSFHLDEMPIDMVAFPGHKSLFGPQGTGGLYVNPEVPLHPLIQGGTGNRSEEVEQPLDRPYGYESGTPNTPGIAGLGAGIDFIIQTGLTEIYQHEYELTRQLWEGLQTIEGVSVLTSSVPALPIVSFNMENVDGIEVATILDQHYQIAVRAGFHCAALKHRSLKTEHGAVRVSPGYFNTKEQIDAFIDAIREISAAFKHK